MSYKTLNSKVTKFNNHLTLFNPCLITTDPCLQVIPPCMTEADRFSMEALHHIHREMDDDQDGCIEVEESVEVINRHKNVHQPPPPKFHPASFHKFISITLLCVASNSNI